MSQVVPEIVMVTMVCQSLNPSHKQVHMKYVSPPIHGEWHETLHARSPDPSALFFARRVWLARLDLSSLNDKHSCQLFRMGLRDKTTPTLTTPLIRANMSSVVATIFSSLAFLSLSISMANLNRLVAASFSSLDLLSSSVSTAKLSCLLATTFSSLRYLSNSFSSSRFNCGFLFSY